MPVKFILVLRRKILNLPNKLSMFRIILVPAFVYFLLGFEGESDNHIYAAILIFAIAAITDKIDGTIARKYNLITNLGKFLDPLADKLLTISAFICLSVLGLANIYIVLIIVARELSITAFRAIAIESGQVLAADKLGKIKTFLQFAAILLVLLGSLSTMPDFVATIGDITFILAGIMTVVSGANYFIKNKHCISEQNS